MTTCLSISAGHATEAPALPFTPTPMTRRFAFMQTALALYLGVGLLYSIAAIRDLQRWRNRKTEPDFPMAGMQIGLWVLSVLTALVLLISYGPTVSMLPLLFAQLLPRGLRPKQSCFVEGP